MPMDEVEKKAEELARTIAQLKQDAATHGDRLQNLDQKIAAIEGAHQQLRQAQEAVNRAMVDQKAGGPSEVRCYLADEAEYKANGEAEPLLGVRGRAFLKNDKGAVRLLGHYQDAPRPGVKLWRWGLLDDPNPRSEWQRALQAKVTERAIVRACLLPEKRYTPRMDAEVADLLRGGPAEMSRIFSDSTGIGAEWIPDRAFPELERDVLHVSNFTAIFEQRDVGPGGTVRLPYKSGNLRVYKHAVPATDNPADDILSTWSTADRTIDPVHAVVAAQVDRDAQEDSIVPVIPEITQDMRDAFSFADDDTWVNGDTQASHQDAIASWDTRKRLGSSGLGTTADHRRRWDGLRRRARALTSMTTDQNAAQTADGLRTALLKLAVEHLLNSDGRVNIVIAVSPEYFFGKMIDWDEFDAFDNVGVLASVLTGQLGDVSRTPGGILPGQVGFLWGRFPVVLCYTLTGDLAATGLFTGSGSTTGMLQFDRTRMQTWVRKGAMLESETKPSNNTVTLYMRKRNVGRYKDAVSSSIKNVHYSYNLTY